MHSKWRNKPKSKLGDAACDRPQRSLVCISPNDQFLTFQTLAIINNKHVDGALLSE